MEIQQTKYPVLAATLKCKMTSAASSLFSTKIQNCTADLSSRQMIRYLERNGDEWFCLGGFFSHLFSLLLLCSY